MQLLIVGLLILCLLVSTNVLWRQNQMAVSLADLKTKVDNQTTVIASANTLLSDLSSRIKAGANDPQAMQDLADEIDSNTNALSAAVANNTDAEDETPAAGSGT